MQVRANGITAEVEKLALDKNTKSSSKVTEHMAQMKNGKV